MSDMDSVNEERMRLETERLNRLPDDYLVDALVAKRELVDKLRETSSRIETILFSRLVDRGATVLNHATQIVEIKEGRPSWDESVMTSLLFHPAVDVAALIADGAYTRAYEETVTVSVPAKWNFNKAKKLRKLGDAIAAIVDSARIAGVPRLSIKPKPVKADE